MPKPEDSISAFMLAKLLIVVFVEKGASSFLEYASETRNNAGNLWPDVKVHLYKAWSETYAINHPSASIPEEHAQKIVDELDNLETRQNSNGSNYDDLTLAIELAQPYAKGQIKTFGEFAKDVYVKNRGNEAACAAVYEIACESLLGMPGVPEDSRKDLAEALVKMRAEKSAHDKAWILRRALDRTISRGFK